MNKLYKIVNDFFSSKYANKNAIVGNIVSLILYKLAYPTASLFAKFSIKPNLITWLSILFTCIAALFLFQENGPFFFVLFWLVSVHLDFSDGTLARMTKKVSKSAFRLDHLTDLIKLCLVFVSFGIFYNTFETWVLVNTSIFSFLYCEILNLEIKYYSKQATLSDSNPADNTLINSKWIQNTGIFQFKALTTFLRNIHSVFFGISGHSLLFFCVLPFGLMYANIFLIYFTFVCTYSSIRIIITLNRMKR